MNKIIRIINIFVLFGYFLGRFFLSSRLDSLGVYSSYYFELIVLLLFFALNYKIIFSNFKINWSRAYVLPVFSILGFAVYYLLMPLGIDLPLDISLSETLFFLLLVAPILEECIFRFFIWLNLEFLKVNQLIILVSTSVIFSYSHLHAIWFVDGKFAPFIIYQSIYTLLLGLFLGDLYRKANSIILPICAHFLFNFGFYLGFKFLV